MARTGRPSSYTKEIADEICTRLASGESMVDICGQHRDRRLPHRQTVYVWLAERPEFQRAYRVARDMQADLFFDEIIKIADARDAEDVAPRDVRRDTLRVAVRKWTASKLAPRRYGDHVAIMGETEDDAQARIADEDNAAARIAAILEAARRRKGQDEG